MRLLHTSDWHLGMMVKNGASYIKEQEHFINEICKIAQEENVDGIIIAGDIFDKSIASKEALSLYDKYMTYICNELKLPVFIVAGNHDGSERLSQCNELLKNSGLYIAGALTRSPQVVHFGNVDIYLLPWITTDKVRSIYYEDADKITYLEDAYKIVLDEYRKTFIDGHINILVAHAFIANSMTSTSDHAAEIGSATMVSAELFHDFYYVALGHLHGPQSIKDNIRYSGTPMTYSFGKEELQEKSVTICDTDTNEQKIIPISQLRKRMTIKGTYDEIMGKDYDDEVLDAYLKIEVTDRFVGLEMIEAFREKFRNLLEISGKNIEKENSKITMTIDEFEESVNDPGTIFKRYCEDIWEETPSSEIIKLFDEARLAYEKEISLL